MELLERWRRDLGEPGGEYGISAQWWCGASPCPSYYYDPAMVTTDQSTCGAGCARSGAAGSEFNLGSYGN
jgi:hypothetical protein